MDPGVRRNRKSSSNFCKYCKRKVHSEDGCFFKEKESQDKSFCTENPGSNRLTEMKGFESSNVETTVTRERSAEFLIDSAATTHICNQRDWFSNLKQIYPTEVLVGERDSSAKAVGIGDIKFTILDINGKVEINFKNVLNVSKMRRNLICGAQIDIVGNYIEWGRDKMIVYNSRKEYIFSVNRVDKLHIVYGYPTKYEAKFKDVALISNLKLDFVHRKFCHENIPLIQSMSKNNSVKDIERLSKSKVENCVNCKIAKSARSSLKKNYTYRRTTQKATIKYSDTNQSSANDSRSEESSNAEIYETLEYEYYNSELPKTFEDTQRSKDKEKCDFAMREELNMMKTRKDWELVHPPANKTIIGSKWVYNIKHDEKINQREKHKAKLVALGLKQKAGIDYGETFSPVVNFSVVKLMFIVLESLLGWNHVQPDVKSAYLYDKLNELVYLKQPPGFLVKDAESKVHLLHKALYDLHQSGRSWNCELDHILKNLMFDKLLWSNCLYKNKDVILVIYVDDSMVFGKTLIDINKTIALIQSKLDLTELGPAKYLLGENFEMNKDLFMHQKNVY
ncbi:Retrovirus-related Pol polyprotein from transposon TNT 1-94 [Araneus ventricosus]|uniref:Retrovirus-related Pol polyprotein from transposon TNT 1-94 n=1 Tax=Araneus ventricosus TaxID=182803 RepID=A0A4Y2QF13_ARAVE|nr:Retrovirus-related Pol polyprotein from transposon TNT 1-94 [Araneus ventricosus]